MKLISLAESLKVIQTHAERIVRSTERISTREALDRVVSSPVHADRPNPSQPLAALDGIAIDFRSVSELPSRLKKEEWLRINTGEALLPQFNAVVRIEDVKWEDEIPVLENPVEFFQNVRRTGEDFDTSSLLFSPGHQLLPQDLSLLLSAGHREVEVYRKPVVTFMPTGSEIVTESSQQQPGKVMETNSAMIAGMVESWGGVFYLTGPVPDDLETLQQKIKLYAAKSDIFVISAGTSKGSHDVTAQVLQGTGILHFHGVAISPARPVLFAEVEKVPVLGLPGYPVAAYLASHLFLRPLVCSLSGTKARLPLEVFVSAEEVPAREMDHFYRVSLYDVDGQIFVRRITGGAGSLASLSQMDGLMHIPPNIAIRKRDAVRIDVIQNRSQNTYLFRGVSDPLVFRLCDLLRQAFPSFRFLHSETSSEEALQNIVERNCHAAFIAIPVGGVDLFPPFAKQIQEGMMRYRFFTRTVGLLFQSSGENYSSLDTLPKAIRFALPAKNLALWDQFRFEERLDESKFLPVQTIRDEKTLTDSLEAGHWEAAFVDIRFLRQNQYSLGAVQEHIDLVISESYTQLPAFKKLIEILLSEEFAAIITAQNGCDVRSRGLFQPSHEDF